MDDSGDDSFVQWLHDMVCELTERVEKLETDRIGALETAALKTGDRVVKIERYLRDRDPNWNLFR